MKMVLLADLNGTITDYNLLAETALKHATPPKDTDGPLQLALSDLGLDDFTDPEFRRPNGFAAELRLGGKLGECLVQVEPLSARVYGGSAEAEDEEERMVVTSEKQIGFRVWIARNEHGHH